MPNIIGYSKVLRFTVAAASLLWLTTANSQQDLSPDTNERNVRDEIVVVAHKSARPVSDIAAHVTVLTKAELGDAIATSFADVFQYTPGVDYEAAGSRFGTEGINIRGIGGNRVALLVDGVPLSDQFDVGSFSNATRDFINAGLIERVEVLHGPASALYGSSAIGGVVAVRTPDPTDLLNRRKIGGDFSAAYKGADASTHANGTLALGDEKLGFILGGSLREGEQTDAAAAAEPLDFRNYRRESLLAKVVGMDRLNNTWRLGVIHQDSAVQSDLNSMLGAGRYATTTALLGHDDYLMDLINLAYEFGNGEGWIDSGLIRVFHQASDVQQYTLDERALATRPVSIDRYFRFEQLIKGAELNLQKTVQTGSVDHQLGFGLEYRERQTEEYRDGLERGINDGQVTNTLLGEVFPLRDFPISDSAEWGAYFEDVMSVGDWSIIAALRGDHYSLSPQNDPMYAEDFPFAEPVSLAESDVSPKLGLIFHASDSVEVYMQYSHGFRAPPYEDANIGLEMPLFNYRAIPNPDLKSESSDGLEAGIRWRGAESDFRLALFHTQYDDFIESKMRIGTDPISGRTLFQSQNIRATVIKGIEGGGSLRLKGALQNVSLDGSFYLARGENKDTGEALNSVGPGQLVSSISWASNDGKRSAKLQGIFTEAWSHLDQTSGELFQPPGYSTFDFYLTQHIGENLSVRLGLLNLTDKTYWRWSDVRGLSPTDPVIPYLSQAGRSLSVSVGMNWQ